MFKHITRLTARSSHLKTSSFTALKLPNYTLTNKLGMRSFASFSQVSQDFTNLHKVQKKSTSEGKYCVSLRVSIDNIDPRKAAINASMPDYEVTEMDEVRMRTVEVTHTEVLNKHPFEIAMAEQREKLEYRNLKKNDLLLFNMPPTVNEAFIRELCSVKGVQIIDLSITKGIDETNIAFAKVTVGHPRQVKLVKDALYNKWIEDKKLKVKTKEDLAYETYNNRTIIVKNIPINCRDQHLIQLFEDAGTISGLELPLKDISIEEHIKNKADPFREQQKEQNEREIRRAQQIVKESIQNNEEYEQFLTNYLGEERAQLLLASYQQVGDQFKRDEQVAILDQSRKLSVHNILTQLQSESTEVRNAKSLLEKLRTKLEAAEVPSLPQSGQDLLSTAVEDEKVAIRNAVKYLNKNREEIDEETLGTLNRLIYSNLNQQADPLQRLQELSKSELALAYDNLIDSLVQREGLIEQRIKDQINHLGKEERILFEEKDWSKELEDIKDPLDPFQDVFKAEEYLSVSEQVRNVIYQKNLPPEIKLYHIVTRLINPFEKANFNETHLANMESTELNDLRSFPRPDPSQPPSVARMNFTGAPLETEVQQYVDGRIEELRGQFDMPFDELYHKEKKLIEQVIKAEQVLKNKESILNDPVGEHRKFDPKELPTGTLEGTGIESEHQFVRDQRKQQEKLFNEQIDINQGSGKFEYLLNDSSEAQRLIAQGIITQQDYDKYLKMKVEANRVNLGYAFVTFSLSDQAKLALIMTTNAMADGVQIETFLKGNLDHKDMDMRYALNKLKNDSKVVDEIENLRTAKKELRDFERNLDQDLPSLKKLNQFRKLARDHVENKQYEARVGYERTKEEEEKVNEMLRKLQKENPDIDYTQLFDTERAEQARRAQHKKALASYKAYQFLKHGVEFQGKTKEQKVEQPKNKLLSKDPYEFPPVDQTVAQFLTKGKFPRVIKGGDSIDRPGRRFGYSEQDFLEAYFGKDYAKLSSSTVEIENPVFGYNEALKHKYPVDKYLQLPVLDAQRKRVEEVMGEKRYEMVDKEFEGFLNEFDLEKDAENRFEDFPHPSIQGRTMLGDLEIRLKNHLARKQKQFPEADPQVWNPMEARAIWQSLYEEYFPGEQPPKRTPRRRDQRRNQKFEPHYEGEAAANDAPAQESTPVKEDEAQPQKSEAPTQQRRQHATPRQQQQKAEYDQVELDQGRVLDPDLVSLNRDFVYDYKHNKRVDESFDPKRGAPIKLQKFAQAAEDMEMPADELYEKISKLGNFSEKTKYGGTFSSKQKLGMLDEGRVQTREKAIRNLNDYARDSESEREDEDIYAHYINQMNLAKKEKVLEQEKMSKEEKLLAQQLEDMEKMLPETPRFEGFFKSQSKGKHPFEEDEYKFDEEVAEQQEDQRRADEEYDEELYQRELKGRLMGQKLTPRQFEVLFKSRLDENAKLTFEKDEQRQQYITQRDIASLLMEKMEEVRRRKVLDGEWTEEESHQKLIELAKQAQNEIPSTTEDLIREREFQDNLALYISAQHPNQFYDKEYYFDEGLGETVQQHAEKIKSEFPDIQVQVRRDRDGYAIIRTLYKPKFKYDLDEIAKYDPQTTESKIKESLNEVLKNILPVDKDAITDFSKLDKQTLENSIRMFTPYGGNEEESYDLDAKSKDAMDRLIQERFTGRYKDDNEGFAKAFMDFSQTATFDPTKKLTKSMRMDMSGALNGDEILEDFEKQREQMTYELSQQISLRVKEHLFYKERKPTDFISGRVSEQSLFSRQVDNYEKSAQVMQQQNEDLLRAGDNNEQGFDKEAYQQIKAEIKKRRDAKERLLKQGFPELKPYISI